MSELFLSVASSEICSANWSLRSRRDCWLSPWWHTHTQIITKLIGHGTLFLNSEPFCHPFQVGHSLADNMSCWLIKLKVRMQLDWVLSPVQESGRDHPPPALLPRMELLWKPQVEEHLEEHLEEQHQKAEWLFDAKNILHQTPNNFFFFHG